MALAFEWLSPDKARGESDEDVILCELIGAPGTKRDVALT